MGFFVDCHSHVAPSGDDGASWRRLPDVPLPAIVAKGGYIALTGAAGVKMVHLPSKGAGETLTAMLRGDIHITESNVASNIGAVKDGRIRAFAVTAAQRLGGDLDVLWVR